MLKKISLTLIVLVFYSNSFSQLVNIESKRMQLDSVRFAFKGDLLFSYNNTNGDYIFQIRPAVTSQYKTKDLKKIFFFIGNYNLVRSKEQDFLNSWFFHIRYNQKLSKLWRLEAFVQNQNNELLTINSRNLIGAGFRLKFISTETIRAYFGNSYMYEVEKIKSPTKRFYNHRNSSYLSATLNFKNSALSLSSTTYFQPLYRSFDNYRILHQLKAELPITNSLSFSSLFDYFYNSFSPNEDKDYNSYISFGFTLNI